MQIAELDRQTLLLGEIPGGNHKLPQGSENSFSDPGLNSS